MRHRRLSVLAILFVAIALLAAWGLWHHLKLHRYPIMLGALHHRDGVFVDDFNVIRAIHRDCAAEVEHVVRQSWGGYPPGSPPSHKVVWSKVPDLDATGIILLDLHEQNLNESELKTVLSPFRELKWLRLPRFMSLKNRELLASFHKLEGLSLGNSSFEDGGFESVEQMKQLKWLDCTSSAITNNDLLSLRECSELQLLAIGDTRVDDDGVAWIAQNLVRLQRLVLPERITDAGVISLERMQKLKSLRGYRCNITDRSLETLERMQALRYVNVALTRISKAGLEKFREARPDITVDAIP